uniref:Uncharacterized protein n=1 Tax=Arcella intermedia TaxID=1963864 RepID=A0A6B2LVD5_9EUKA
MFASQGAQAPQSPQLHPQASVLQFART